MFVIFDLDSPKKMAVLCFAGDEFNMNFPLQHGQKLILNFTPTPI